MLRLLHITLHRGIPFFQVSRLLQKQNAQRMPFSPSSVSSSPQISRNIGELEKNILQAIQQLAQFWSIPFLNN